MTFHKPKRVWDQVSTGEDGNGFAVFLDGRTLRTPARSPLVTPTQALAEAIAAEWDAQSGVIDPLTMPLTRTANSAIDKVAVQKSEVASAIAAYGDSDLLCYRAETPAALVTRQVDAWDPILDWADRALGARLIPRNGIIHIPQSSAALTQLADHVNDFSVFELAGFHDLVALTGSLILGFAVVKGHQTADQIWATSRIDEHWQTQEWGADELATAQEDIKRVSFFDAEMFVRLSQKKA